jgi:hypothetical protein
MKTPITPKTELKEKGQALIAAAYEYWKEFQKVSGPAAVVWIEDDSGHLICFTRGEYKEIIMKNISPLIAEIPLDDPFLVDCEDDPANV